MQKIRLSEVGVEAAALRAAAVLRAGGVILYPTDTLYGLGGDAFSDEAVAKIRHIKGREERKPIHCIVADREMMEQYAHVSKAAGKLAERFFPGPLTIVLKKKHGIDSGIARDMDTIGIRIPKNEFCTSLSKEFQKPFTTTSANVSGLESRSTVAAILAQFGDQSRHLDLVIDAGELSLRAPSTVVDVSGKEPMILREGAIPASDIFDALRG